MAAPLPDSDGDLVRIAAEGRQDAYSALYERYFQSVLDFLTRLLRNREEAADVAQDTFIKAFEQLHTLETPEKFKSWLFTIAHRRGLNRIRSSKRTAPGYAAAVDDDERATMAIADADPSVNPEQVAAIQEASDIVWEAAAGLDPRTYTVMDLHIRQGLDSAEIADVMGVTKGNAYTMVSRMKQSFSNTLATYLLVQRGRSECSTLARVIPSDVDQMTPELRKAADRHVNKCDVCAENRVLYLTPVKLFAALLMVPVPVGLKAAIWGKVAAATAGVAAGAGAGAAAGAGTSASGSGAGGTAVGATASSSAGAATAGTAAVGAATAAGLGPIAAIVAFVQSQAAVVAGVAAAAVLTVGGAAIVANNQPPADPPPAAAAASVDTAGADTADDATASTTIGPETTTTVTPDTTTPPPTPPPPTSPPPTSPPPTTPPPTTPPPTTVPPPPPLVVGNDGALVDEDGSVSIAVLANDTGNAIDPNTLIVSAAPANGVATVDAGQVRYTPNEDFFGSDSLTYSVATESGESGTGDVTIVVTPINDVPVVPGPPDPSVDEDGVLTFEPLEGAVDVDGDPLTMVAFDAVSAAGGTITEGSIVYEPPANFNGTDTFTYTVSDGTADVVVTVEVAIAPIPDPPQPPAGGTAFETDEDIPAVIDLLDGWVDPDGDALSVIPGTYSSDAGGAVVVAANGVATYTPPADYVGADGFGYTVTDGQFETAADAVITVSEQNDGPEPPDDDVVIEATEDQEAEGELLVGWTDPDGDELSALAGTFPTAAGAEVVIEADGHVVYVPLADFNGDDSFEYSVTDGSATTTATALVSVAPVNDVPEVDDAEFDVAEVAPIGTVIGVVTATDVDGDSLTFTAAGSAVAIDSTGTVTVAGALDAAAEPTIVIQSSVDDGNGGVAEFSVTVNVLASNGAPGVDDATFVVDGDGEIGDFVGTVQASDPDGDELTFAISSGDPDGYLTIDNAGVLRLLRDVDGGFPSSVTVTATDPSGLTGSAVITFVLEDDDSPQLAHFAADTSSIFAPKPNGDQCSDKPTSAVLTAQLVSGADDVATISLTWEVAETILGLPAAGEVPVKLDGEIITGEFTWPTALLGTVKKLPVAFTLTVVDDAGNIDSQGGVSVTVRRCQAGGDD